MTRPRSRSRGLNKRFGGLPATRDVSLTVMPGERRLIIGPNGAGKTTLFNLITGDLTADSRLGEAVRAGAARHADAAARASRARAHLPDPHAVPARDAHPQRGAGAARSRQAALESVDGADRPAAISTTAAREALAQVGLGDSAERIVAETSYGERRRLEMAMALAQKPKVLLLDEPLAGLSQDERQTVRALLDTMPRDVTIVMIEHDMDTALAFAERITVLHYGEVIVEGTRAEVVADPRTREVYLGD